VPLSWPRAFDLLAEELRRVYAAYGPRAIFGGSYGWASAGRFHDAQSQIHRFLNLAGGYVRSVGSYSSGAATVILPHVIGPQGAVASNTVSWDELVAESALVLAFGGMALKNNDVGGGGTSRHVARGYLHAARDRAAATASRKTRAGRRQSAASRRKISSPSRGASRGGAHWSPARNPCSAPNTASSRSGWAWC
jgi:biotin/methionine sulfoxide reductase